MSLEKLLKADSTSTTRRTIVKTGVKLAYAAPLVAATTRLDAAKAQTVSVGNPDPECQGAVCGPFEIAPEARLVSASRPRPGAATAR